MIVAGDEVAKHCEAVKKINPNGVDLVPKEITTIPPGLVAYLYGDKRGFMTTTGEFVEGKRLLLPDRNGFYNFKKGGIYELRFPRVDVPADCTGFAFPRSSVNRLGLLKFETAVFDSGYAGEPTQTILAPLQALIQKDEALVQLVFVRNEKAASSPYQGFYQDEKGRTRR